jgi:tRNA(Ile)-lysidine synthase
VNGKTIRPMLPFTAKEIRQYAEDHHIAYVEDYTNRDETISRNLIRHSVIPQLETINSHFLHTNIRTRQILQRQYAYYQKHIEAVIANISSTQNDQILIDRSLLEACEDRELILYEILNRYGFSSDVSEKLSESFQLQPGKQFLSDTHILLIDRAFLILKPKMDEEPESIEIRSLEGLQQYFHIEEFEYQQDIVFDKNPDLLYIPKEKLTFPLTIRSWQHGDFFYPLGGRGRQKLSDYFTDHKIDRFTKERIRLLCINDQIAWIIGHRSDDRFKLTPKTDKYYLLTPLTINH